MHGRSMSCSGRSWTVRGTAITWRLFPAGSSGRANVDMLARKAMEFESTSYQGLFNFVRYIEQLRKYDVDYGEASQSW